MKSMSAALLAHYASGTTTLATCWKATLTNGTVVAATSHDRDIEFAGTTYQSVAAYNYSTVQSGSELAPDNLELEGFLASPAITDEDILSGIWDYAAVEMFEVNYADLTMGRNMLRYGTLGQVRTGRATFIAELRGLTQAYARRIVRLITQECNADLGDARCTIDLGVWTETFAVMTVSDNRTITNSGLRFATNWYTGGKATFTSGENTGLSMEVKSSSGSSLTLMHPMPFDIVAGDTFTVYPGCMKRYAEDCIGKFDNGINFRGFPHLPGTAIYGGPGTRMLNAGQLTPAPVPAPVPAPPAPPASPTPPAPSPGAPAPAPAPSGSYPSIITGSYDGTFLQTGNDDDAYWIHDNRWGQGSITNFMQEVGRASRNQIGANGEVACRMRWDWPDVVGASEVKAYPALVYGRKPGWYSDTNKPGGMNVLLLDGTFSTTAPSGWTPGTFLPQQTPLTSLKVFTQHSHVTAPTGRGHLAFDIWLQSEPGQDSGFASASITHEIMIPLEHWGGYGSLDTDTNPAFIVDTVSIGGRTYDVMRRDNFPGPGALNGNYGRDSWRFIVFKQHDADLPMNGIELDLAAFINYVRANHAVTGTEWVSSIELGVEPNYGTGDLVIHNYRVYT